MNDLLNQKGEFDIEEGLKKMDFDTEAFEAELELFAKLQPPKVQEKLRKQYNAYMKKCGWPMELIVVPEPLPQLPAKERLPELPKPEPTQPQQEPVSPNPNEWTPEQIGEAKLVGVDVVQGDSSHPEPIKVEEPESVPQEIKPNETQPKSPETKELHGYIVMPDAQQLKNLLKTINVLVDEVPFKLTPKGLTLRAMDPSRVAMIDLVIPRESCVEHSCPEDMKFAFSLERFLEKTLKNITKNDGVRLDIQTGLVEKMNTRLFGKLTRQFSMPLLEVSEEEIPTPKINFMYSAKLVLENVNTLFKDLEDHVRITGTQDGLTFEQKGDIEDFKTTLQKGDLTVLNIEAKEDAKATYSVSYLKEILKALGSLTDIVELSYSTDMPMRISADLEHLGTISFYVAPRIESDD